MHFCNDIIKTNKNFVMANENSNVIPDKIKVLSVTVDGLGVEPEKDSPEAIFPATVRWCDVDIDAHVAELSEDDFVKTAKINIYSWTINLATGIYELCREPITNVVGGMVYALQNSKGAA